MPFDLGGARIAYRRPLALLLALAVGSALLSGTGRAADAGCTRDPSWATMAPALAQEVLLLTNAHRQSIGLGELSPSATLTKAAEWKSAHMAFLGYMEHDDPDTGRDWFDRLNDCGYHHGAGENIAYGYKSPASVVQAWLESPGHRRNIENDGYEAIGIGAAISASGRMYWTQNFGSRLDVPLPTEPIVDPSPPPAATNSPPSATGDKLRAVPRRRVRISVLENDLDPDGDPLTISALADGEYGKARINGSRSAVIYRPYRKTAGRTEVLTYEIDDGRGGVDTAQIRIRIRKRR